VPAVVKSWAEARGWTNQQAAENILQEAAMFIGALELIRDIRLKGKYALIALSEEDREVEFRQVISNLKAVG
jgi:hypothetical protein